MSEALRFSSAYKKFKSNPPLYAEYLRKQFLFHVAHWPSLAHFALVQAIRPMNSSRGQA
jgi:hypothetical protein